MAMGLSHLGRGDRKRATAIGLWHGLAAAVGGAATGALLGTIGMLLSLDEARPAVLVTGAAAAFLLGLGTRPPKLGRSCQVPREWARRHSPGRLYAYWGAMLGAGWATLIPHSAYLLVAAAELCAGPALGAASGALYGLGRELPALAGLRSSDPEGISEALPRLSRLARRANAIVALAGGAGLAAVALA